METTNPEELMNNEEQLTVIHSDNGIMSREGWEIAQRMGQCWAKSSLVPSHFQNNIPNCIVALEIANRMGASPLLVMQNLYLVHGNPGWSSKFLIASFNQCGRFTALRYEWNTDRSECRAWATEKKTGDRIEGPAVSLEMAKNEGWSTKNGSKWKTMPELMLMYRAAAFMIRTYAPEISMGLQTADEVEDIGQARVVEDRPADKPVRLPRPQFILVSAEVKAGKVTIEEVEEQYPTLVADQMDELRGLVGGVKLETSATQ